MYNYVHKEGTYLWGACPSGFPRKPAEKR